MDISDQIRQKEEELQRLKQQLKSKNIWENGANLDKRSNPACKSPKIDVPSSPSKDRVPARILFGIDKGTKAADISLKRPSSSSLAPKSNAAKSTNAKRAENQAPSFLERMTSHRRQEDHKTAIKHSRIYRFGTGSNIGASISHKKPISAVKPNIEKYSRLRITDRYLDQETLKTEFEDKKVLSVSKLYAKVYPPDYQAPEYPNYVVMGIVARKSQTKLSKVRSKFIMLTLTDLKLDISVAIHRDAFDEYWKIREGTLIAILNPEIYVTSDKDHPAVALSISRSDDCILEIGRSTDLARCAALNSKGTQCHNWVDSTKAMYCEYHISLGMKRSSQQRMEFNSVASRLNEPKLSALAGSKYIIQTRVGDELTKPVRPIDHKGHIPMGKIPSSFFGDDEEEPELVKIDRKRKENAYKKQQETRTRLSQRPEAVLLRRYDQKGNLISDPETNNDQPNNLKEEKPLFTPKQLRILGFDPTNQAKCRPADVSIGHNNASEVNLKKPRLQHDDSDDDLIIEG